jgi:hypothetical protein
MTKSDTMNSHLKTRENRVEINVPKHDIKKWRKNLIKTILKEILYNSLAQAIIKIIFTPRHFILRMFLLTFVLSSSSFSSYLVIKSFIDYFNFRVSTSSRTIYETPTLFPKITFCNLNTFVTEFAWNLTQMGIEDGSALSIEDKKKLGHILDDILLDCYYNGYPCNSNEFTWMYDLWYGNCFEFNSGLDSNLKESSFAGPYYGLHLTLYVNVYEKLLYSLTNRLGALIRIGNSSHSYYYDDGGIFVSPGFETFLNVDREFKSVMPKPYSDCEIDSNSPKFIQGLDLYNLILESDYEYTQQLCFVQCYQRFIISKYNCSHPWFLTLFHVINKCTSEQNDLIKDKFNHDFINKYCISLCPLECSQTLYKTSLSFSHFSLDSIKIKNNSNLSSDFIHRNLDLASTIEKSVAKVNIFYDRLSYTLTTDTPQMDAISLLGSIGGNLGLFLGVSVFSLCEVVEAFIEIFYLIK